VYRYGLPLGVLLLALALVAAVFAMSVSGRAAWAGLGAAALLGYAGVMSVYVFEGARPPVA
jgi:hypothetical protein